MTTNRLLAALLLATPLLTLSAPSRAASSFEGCKGFITTLPATISTQGVWCLNADLATPLASGAAITVTTNNVTIDCNSFKLGGLGAGPTTSTTGVSAADRVNISLRDCNIRGFQIGATIGGTTAGGHRVERNRFEGNTSAGMVVQGPGSVVRDNQVLDTGGSEAADPLTWTVGIVAVGRVDVIDNHISGIDGTSSASGYGIGVLVSSPEGSAIAGNRIGSIFYTEGGSAYGIAIMGSGPLDIRNNTFASGMPGNSVACSSGGQYLYANALMMGEPSGSCLDGGANYGLPILP